MEGMKGMKAEETQSGPAVYLAQPSLLSGSGLQKLRFRAQPALHLFPRRLWVFVQ